MSEVKNFNLSSVLNSQGIIKSTALSILSRQIDVYINFKTGVIFINHEKVNPGDLNVVTPDDIVLSVNKKGQLICICEERITPSINSEGELIFTISD